MSTPDISYKHLLPEAAHAAMLSDAERITYIDSDRWLPYQRANEVLGMLEDFLLRPRINRPPNMMLVGSSDNGKSHILERFSELHPGQPNLNGRNIIAPVLMVETPPTANANDLYDMILSMLNRPRPSNKNPESRREAVKDILRIVETKILMLDEINHLLSGNANRQREFLFALKHLSNELRMSIVIAGTPESFQLLHLSDQIENRFQPQPLTRWTVGTEMRTLLANFEQVLPLRKPSLLSRKDTALLIHSFGVETIGRISVLLNDSAKEAIKSGAECITEDILKKCAPKTKYQTKLDRSRL